MNRTTARLLKLARLLVRPWSWRALRHGVGPSVEHERVLRSISNRGIKTVIDVGANVGQFTAITRQFLPDAHVWAFEPLAAAGQTFDRVHAHDHQVHRDGRALGSSADRLPMNISAAPDSSSLLPISAIQEQHFPGTATQGTTFVDVVRFDSLPIAQTWERPVLVKLDVQGYELSALDGFGSCMDQVDFVYLELSLVSFYEGQPLAAEITGWLNNRGFQLRDIGDTTRSKTGELLQYDALFERQTTRPTEMTP